MMNPGLSDLMFNFEHNAEVYDDGGSLIDYDDGILMDNAEFLLQLLRSLNADLDGITAEDLVEEFRRRL